MLTSLRSKFIACFLMVVIITGVVSTWIGIHLIGNGILREAQKRVEMDLNSAREVYQGKVEGIRTLVRLTALRFFVKKALISGDMKALNNELMTVRETEGLDILTLTDSSGKVIVRTRNPRIIGDIQTNDELVSKVLSEKKAVASTQIISREELIKESEDLASQSYMRFISTPLAKLTEKREETFGMMIKSAAPIMDGNRLLGVLYGGKLLNRNYEIVDKIKDIVYHNEIYKGKDIGTATIFQGDLRISTNVMHENGERAIRTRVCKEVYEQVIGEEKSWVNRAFVVNDWYITAYEPIRDIKDKVIGMLYVGILEKKYVDLKRQTLLTFLGITGIGVISSLCLSFLLANGIIKPIRYLVLASKQIAKGNLESRVACNSKDELGELGVSFNSMASSLKERETKLKEYAEREMMRSERLASLGQVAGGVAHEINNPLAVILGRAEFIGSELENADPLILKSIKTIEREAEKAASTIRKFLSFARLPDPKLELTDINKLLEESLTLASHQALIEKIKVTKELDAQIPKILLDSHQIQQVFINVILNAFQSMPNGGELFVTTGLKDGFVETVFTDTGCGIDKDTLNKVFEPFFTTKKAGTGLGLAISKSIIDKHDGFIQIESEANKGTNVTIKLPVKNE